jgi:hypothetical protein
VQKKSPLALRREVIREGIRKTVQRVANKRTTLSRLKGFVTGFNGANVSQSEPLAKKLPQGQSLFSFYPANAIAI